MSFVGDMTLGNYAGQAYDGSFDQEYEKQNQDSAYYLKNVKDVFEKDDLTIANLEDPLTTSQDYAEKTFVFQGKPEYVDILADGDIEAVTLANNHSKDHFEQGMTDTKAVLDEKGIRHFGYDESCMMDVKGIQVGFLGYAFPYELTAEMKKAISDLKAQCDIVVVYYHWGIERQYQANEDQRSLAKFTIDAGADAVIGSHPHVVQGSETYQNKPIIYSLGNFCFGGNRNPSDTDSMIYQLTYQFKGNEQTGYQVHIVPCALTSTSGRNDYQPKILTGDEGQRVLDKIRKYSY